MPETPNLPHLQPELWSHIIKLLRRTPPPAHAMSTSSWKDLHQHDLAMISLVCSMQELIAQEFHELAIPYLYTSIIAPGIPSLLRSVDNSIPSLGNKITSKRKRFEGVKNLCLAPLDLELEVEWDVSSIISRKLTWEVIGETEDHREARVKKTTPMIYSELSSAVAPYLSVNFQSLDTLVIFPRKSGGWFDAVGTRYYAYGLVPFDHQHTRSLLTMLYLSWNPRVICTHVSWSPYIPSIGKDLPCDKLESLVYHHVLPIGFMPLETGFGVINRHYGNPAFSYARTPPEEGQQFVNLSSGKYLVDKIKQRWRIWGEKEREAIVNTRLELPGFCAPDAAMTFPVIYQSTTLAPPKIAAEYEEALVQEKNVTADTFKKLTKGFNDG